MCGQTKAMPIYVITCRTKKLQAIDKYPELLGSNYQSLTWRVGDKIMLEKLLLAISITFSLNVFMQIQVPLRNDSEDIYAPQVDRTPQILVRMLQK
ncbi:hypothetical protein IQ247_25850 [Plectonema cf. radiosum LEGE 06105]|uniref:Uncharacterized protein n=1 Tax=Plectonema cf. radiosum LEGE 06105 TaxID=945769 RepID=A0A8J7JVP5_9CYAN|nr:hypothetical protein [Plectonema radiosum]MBE9216044.1 hypothetical protein [Plectonema cf. radiosum LEGE 06105]